ncbi:MAG: hypothetical protein J5851_06250 [Oscillospiraceae bacterium]|nr:hypothetical protein [Oscillospiraceae bacterium]
MPERGRTIVTFFGAYLIGKSVLNLILGFSMGNIISLVIAVVIAALWFFGVKYTNYIVTVILLFVVVWHLKDNITGFPGTWLYLTEAVVDIAVAACTVFVPDIKAHFERD